MRVSLATPSMALLALLVTCLGPQSAAQTSPPKGKEFPLWRFDEQGQTCRVKGRLQDKDYCDSRMMDQIVAQGKAAIPILISQLTDTRERKEPIYDFWHSSTVGDIASAILNDLFTDSDWTTFTMPGLDALHYKCEDDAETCWRRFLEKHGRKFVQEHWQKAWDANKDRIYWDEKACCFRVSAKSK